jgi:hypothetical protein
VEAALKSFTAVVTVINYPENHWVTLRFDTEKEILEVFDSKQPEKSKGRMKRMEEINKVRYVTPNILFSNGLNNK